MILDNDACYQALLAHDARFDGLFFVGISSTGIYCRTVCPARRPKRENCAFFPSAAAAEHAGYRPCLRCRPELAPGNAHVDSSGRLAASIAGRIEDGALGEQSLEALAADLGVSDRHARRAVRREFGVSPVQFAQTQRLLVAKRLLTDTDLPVTEVAFASGFSSLRRFNALFQERYRLNPTALRKSRGEGERPDVLRCELAYRPPFDLASMLTLLSLRTTSGVERAEGERYLRTVRIGEHCGWIVVSASGRRSTLTAELSVSLAPALVPSLRAVKRAFDLDADPVRISDHLGPLAAGHPGLRVPGAFDGFETAVRAVLGQQVTVKAATTLSGRLAAAFGESIQTPFEGLTHLSPTPQRIAEAAPEELASLGMPLKRAASIVALAEAVAAGRIVLEPRAEVESVTETLKAIPGIGEWTAQYIAMRALGWPDAFPHTDLGVMQALGERRPRAILERAEAWRPWRAYAVMHLWKSLEKRP